MHEESGYSTDEEFESESTPIPEAPPDPATQNTVFFARKLNPTFKPSNDLKYRNAHAIRTGFVLYLGPAMALAYVLTRVGFGKYHLGLFLLAGVFTAGSIALFVPMLQAWRDSRRNLKGMPELLPETARLGCVGAPAILSSFGEWEDVSFEPEIFRGGFGVWKSSDREWHVRIIGGLACLGVIVVLRYALLGSLLRGMSAFDFWIAFCFAEGANVLFWPVYLRLLPGRLDVMQFSALRRRIISIDRIPLTSAGILVNLRERYAVIDTGVARHEIALSFMRDYKRFAYYLFLAAISSYRPPTLPDDELLG